MCAIINKTVWLNVKNTMIDRLLSLIAPHHCFKCGKIGTPLCDNCKYDIISEPYDCCLLCGGLAHPRTGVCRSCKSEFDRAWCVGERRDELRECIDAYKFQRAKEVGRTLAYLLDGVLPQLPAQCIFVPIPTISAHIRERGYDHAAYVAQQLGALRQRPVNTDVLARTHSLVQREASRVVRKQQADTAFIAKNPNPDAVYVVIDDVATTGATLQAATRALKAAGATTVWVAVICRQPLD